MEWLEIVAKAVPVISFIAGIVAYLRKNQKKTQKELELAREGQKCLLRQKMLEIYYANRDRKMLRQYEAQNFIKMYSAYKSMGGNSFVDEVYNHVVSWRLEE